MSFDLEATFGLRSDDLPAKPRLEFPSSQLAVAVDPGVPDGAEQLDDTRAPIQDDQPGDPAPPLTDEWDNLPAPLDCPTCGEQVLDCWWDYEGRQRCRACDPPGDTAGWLAKRKDILSRAAEPAGEFS